MAWQCSPVPLIQRQVPIKLPRLKTLIMTEGASLWFPINWTGARLFRQMNLSRRRGFIWIQINNCLSNLKENNDQNRDSEHYRGLFTLPGNKLVLNLIWKSTELTKIFTKPMRVHCLLLSLVSRERRGVQPLTENSIANNSSLFIWVDWTIETNNQIMAQTFVLINFCGAGCVNKTPFNNGQCLETGKIPLQC